MRRKARPPVEDGNGLVLLVWDAPNMNAILDRILNEGSDAEGPALDAVRRWLGTRGAPGSDVEACMFADLIRGEEDRPLEFLADVRDAGFRIFVKPREAGDRSDLENEILRHIARRRSSVDLAEVIVASHDGASFGDALEALSAEGVRTTVVGFREFAHFARERDEIELVDIEDDIGAFTDRLPRMRLWEVPNEGTWFEATGFPLSTPSDTPRPAKRATPPAANEAKGEDARRVETAALGSLPEPDTSGDIIPEPPRDVGGNGLPAGDRPSPPAERAQDENGPAVGRVDVGSVPPPPAPSMVNEKLAPAPPPPPAPPRVVAETGVDPAPATSDVEVVGASEMEITDLDDDEAIDLTGNSASPEEHDDDDLDLAGPGEDGELGPNARGGGPSGVFDYPESGGPTANLSRRNIRRRRQLPTDGS